MAVMEIQMDNAITVIGGVVVVLLILRWAALPKPIPGIPYNAASASRVAGDIPEMNAAAVTPGVRVWMRNQFAIHGSPVVQIFVQPFN
jgi:hypothetical protein